MHLDRSLLRTVTTLTCHRTYLCHHRAYLTTALLRLRVYLYFAVGRYPTGQSEDCQSDQKARHPVSNSCNRPTTRHRTQRNRPRRSRHCINHGKTIQSLFDQYRTARPTLGEYWFLANNLKNDPDFVSFKASALDNLVQSSLWFEAKILYQFLNIIWLATPNMRDVAASDGIATRKITVKNIKDEQLFKLSRVGMNNLL